MWGMLPYGSQCWSLLLAGQTLGSGYSQIGLDKWKFTFLGLCVASTLVTMGSLFITLLDKTKGGWGRYMTDIQIGSPLLKLLFDEPSDRT